jgi:hypothetical protein
MTYVSSAGAGAGVSPEPMAKSQNYQSIFAAFNSAANASTLFQFPLDANLVDGDQDFITIIAKGSIQGNSHTKNIRIYFGTSVVADSGPLTNTDYEMNWEIEVQLWRDDATHLSGATAVIVDGNRVDSSVSAEENLSSSLSIRLVGQGEASKDIKAQYFEFRYAKSLHPQVEE